MPIRGHYLGVSVFDNRALRSGALFLSCVGCEVL